MFVEFQTIILRFRDLVTETGETILAHDSIIKEKQAVWWAWWNKGNEKSLNEKVCVMQGS